MSYVWSDPVQISVSPNLPSIASVTVNAPSSARVGEPVHIYVNFTLSAPAPQDMTFEVALALNDKSNIVQKQTTYVLAGDNKGSVGFQLVFQEPGTYYIYGGVKYVG